MEIPNNIKRLYSHWEKHLQFQPLNLKLSNIDPNLLNEIVNFSNERMMMWDKKNNNSPRPYTDDPILDRYRFCNIYRELDKQTIEIHSQLMRYKSDLSLWLLNVAFMRFICNTETVSKVGFLSFDVNNNKQVFDRLMSMKSPKFGSAYIFPVSLITRSEYNTREKFFCYYLPKVMKKTSETITAFDNVGVLDALRNILPIFGFNFKFHWTEILIDVAYQFPQFINLYDRFPIGPGSEPTMKRFSDSKNPEDVCLDIMNKQPFSNFEYLTYNSKTIYLSAENIEGIGCEFRKYSNLKAGSGRKRKYK